MSTSAIVIIVLAIIFVILMIGTIWYTNLVRAEAYDRIVRESLKSLSVQDGVIPRLDLRKLLSGHEGEAIYCSLTGEYVVIEEILPRQHRPIIVKDKKGVLWSYPSEGYKFDDYPEGECMLFPSRTERDWTKWSNNQKKQEREK